MATSDEGPDDLFEQGDARSPGAELRREKTVWKWHWIVLAPAIWTFAGMVLTLLAALPGASLAVAAFLGAMTLFFTLLWAAFLVLRVSVSDRAVHVQYGLWGPRIAVAAITGCKVIDYDWKRFGGWGIKRDSEGTWAYTLMGEGKRVVEITWREDGVEKRTVVSSRTPDELAASILQAKAALGGSAAEGTGVRVDAATQPNAVAEEATREVREGASKSAR